MLKALPVESACRWSRCRKRFVAGQMMSLLHGEFAV